MNLGEHPFIVEALWVKAFSGRLFVAMDYVEPDTEGRVSLHDYLHYGRSFAMERAVECAIQFCLAMEHANARGVKCHRDIKPANILIAKGVFKVSDFGLAAAADVACRSAIGLGDSVVTCSAADGFGFSVLRSEGGMRCGTPGYMPPEVYRGENTDVRSDIYSFGLVLWQMAAGSPSPPFGGAYRGDIKAYMRVVYDQQMSGRVPPVARSVGAVIDRCLNPVPSKRYSSFWEMRRALEPIFQKLTGRSVVVPTTDEQTARFWNNKGMSLAALGRRAEAIYCFDKALAIAPHYAEAWNNKGGTLVALERYEDAILCYEKALAIDPRDATRWFNKAFSEDEIGRAAAAVRSYARFLELAAAQHARQIAHARERMRELKNQ